MDGAIAQARAAGRLKRGPFVLGFFERMFLRVLEPPVRLRVKAPKKFVAVSQLSPEVTLARWAGLQERLASCIRSADGLDLVAVRVKSVFGPISFSLNGTILILLAHERRHLWQARQVRVHSDFPGA